MSFSAMKMPVGRTQYTEIKVRFVNIMINSGRTAAFLSTRERLVCSLVEEGHNVVLTGYQAGYEMELNSLGVKFVRVPMDRSGLNHFADLRLLKEYYHLIKENDIDIVHSYTIKPNIYGSIAAWLAGVEEVYPTLNGLGYAFTGDGVRGRVVRAVASIFYLIAFRCSKKVFFHNKDDIDFIVAHRLIDREKCVQIDGSGIDLESFSAEDMPIEISFVLISRLLKSKGILEYAEAARIVKRTHKNVVFNLVGPTDPNPSGIQLSDIQPYIEDGTLLYHGPQEDIRSFLKDSSVVVLPSYREGLPHSLLEGMATGRAILTTDVPGCKETTIEGENGFLVPARDVEALANRMCWMVENPEKTREMGKVSLKIVKERFDVDKVNSTILSAMDLR